MTGFPRPGVRARPDWSFVAAGGPACRWEGDELTFLGFALGGVRRSQPWLIDLKALTAALEEIYGPRFALGDRDLLLQLAVDARAEGDRDLADALAECLRFPPLGYVERGPAVQALSRALGHGRKSGFNSRVSYDVPLPTRLSLAYNPSHLPAGSPNSTGGQFAPREGATPVALTRREREGNLERMKEAVARRPDLPAAVRDAAIEIFDVEGRGAMDHSNGAVAGITRTTLADARAKVPGLANVKSPADLTPAQIVSFYAWYIDKGMTDGGGARRLDEFADRRTAIALADVFVAHGLTGGANMLFDAAQSLLGGLDPEAISRLGLPPHVSDRGAALKVLETLSNDGRAQAVRTAIADQRRVWLEGRENKVRDNPHYSDVRKRRELRRLGGWRSRISRFE